MLGPQCCKNRLKSTFSVGKIILKFTKKIKYFLLKNREMVLGPFIKDVINQGGSEGDLPKDYFANKAYLVKKTDDVF